MFFKLIFSVKENIREINFAIAIISSIVCIDIISFLTFRLHHGNVILPHNPPFHIGAEVQFECLPGNSIYFAYSIRSYYYTTECSIWIGAIF